MTVVLYFDVSCVMGCHAATVPTDKNLHAGGVALTFVFHRRKNSLLEHEELSKNFRRRKSFLFERHQRVRMIDVEAVL